MGSAPFVWELAAVHSLHLACTHGVTVTYSDLPVWLALPRDLVSAIVGSNIVEDSYLGRNKPMQEVFCDFLLESSLQLPEHGCYSQMLVRVTNSSSQGLYTGHAGLVPSTMTWYTVRTMC